MHGEVVRVLREGHPNSGVTPRLLDIPSGDGPVQRKAREAGYDVVGLDLFPSAGLRGVQGDACAALPFQDESFDVVISMEGIEHFENQTDFVRECCRVLKPGGVMILTTPNIMHLSARTTALMTANRCLKHGHINEVNTFRGGEGKRAYHGHAYLIDAFRLRYIMRVVGLQVDSIEATDLSPSSVMLAPMELMIRIATPLSIRMAKKRRKKMGLSTPDQQLESELKQIAYSRSLLYRKKMIAIAHKPMASGTPA